MIATPKLKPVNRHTRATKWGRIIRCSYCLEDRIVHHFKWSSLKCSHCGDFTEKADWLVVPPRPRDRKTAGLILGESWGIEPIKARDLKLVGNWLFVRQWEEFSYHDAEGKWISGRRPDYSVVRWDVAGDLWSEPWDDVPDIVNPFLQEHKMVTEAYCAGMDQTYSEYLEEISK